MKDLFLAVACFAGGVIVASVIGVIYVVVLFIKEWKK